MMAGASRSCVEGSCAATQREDDKHKRVASARTAFPMNTPEVTRMTLQLVKTPHIPLLKKGFARRGWRSFSARKISQPQSSCIYTNTESKQKLSRTFPCGLVHLAVDRSYRRLSASVPFCS